MSTSMKLLVCCMAVIQTSCATLFPHGASRWTGALRVRGGADAEAPAEPKMYPGLSIKEIIEVLDKVPLFGVTDLAGSSVVMQTRDPTSATPDATTGQSIFFFTHADMAKAVLTTLDSSRGESAAALSGEEIPKLKVGVFGLGQTYARFALKASSADMGSSAPDTPLPDGINVKFVADPRDVQGAQRLSYASIAGDAGGALAGGDKEDKKEDEGAMKAAVQKFNETTIPLFTIAQIQVEKAGERMRPWFFSMGDLIGLWRNTTAKQHPDDSKAAEELFKEAEVHIQSLHELVTAMQAESPINFRTVLLVPYEGAGEAVAAAINGGSTSPSSPGAAVGDAVADAVSKMQAAAGLSESDSDDGGLFD